MGRVPIPLKRVHVSKRKITYNSRVKSVQKKSWELSTLTNVEVTFTVAYQGKLVNYIFRPGCDPVRYEEKCPIQEEELDDDEREYEGIDWKLFMNKTTV